MNDQDATSTRPYLIRAIYEWCTDNGLTPYLAVQVDKSVQVPREYVNDGEIVLNAGMDATSGLQLGNEFIEFKARFGGKPRDIMVPVSRVLAIYARETGQGMSFPVMDDLLESADALEEGDEVAEDGFEPEEGAPASDARVVQLVPAASKPVGLASVETEDEGDEPRPPTPGTGRPALKRVK